MTPVEMNTAQLLAYLASQDRYNPKDGMCLQLSLARHTGSISGVQRSIARNEIMTFLVYIGTNWNVDMSIYLNNAIHNATNEEASLAEIDPFCKELYLNWDNRIALVNDFINNHRWGN